MIDHSYYTVAHGEGTPPSGLEVGRDLSRSSSNKFDGSEHSISLFFSWALNFLFLRGNWRLQ